MAIVKEYEMKVNTADAQENVEDLNKEIKETGTDISGVEAAADKATGGMVSGFKGAIKGVKSFIGGLKTMRGALIATGLGAFVIAVGSLAAAFTSSEEGQNKFAKIMGVIGSVTGNLITMLSDLGFKIIEVFENPKQALIDFQAAFVKNITTRIESTIKTFGFLGSAIKKAISLDFSGAVDDAKSAGSSFVDSLTGVEDSVNKVSTSVSNLTTELIEEGKVAGKIADQRAQADKLDRKLTVERAKANRDRAAALESAVNKEKFSVEERIAFLQEAGRIEEEITEKELVSARLRLEAKISENALANSTKEDLEEEANLRANLINLETAKLAKQKEVTSQTIALKAEEAAELKAIDDQKIADQKILDDEAAEAEKKRLENVKKSADEEIRIAQLVAEQKKQVQQANLNNISQGFALLGQIAGKNKAVQAAAIIGESAVGIARTIISTQSANAGALATPQAILTSGVAAAPVIAANNIAAGISIAANVAATAKALGGLKAGGSPPTPPSIATSSSTRPSIPQVGAPNFNIVGQAGASQIADAISGQNQQPFRAYVVAGDVTTGQSLERNIIEGASL